MDENFWKESDYYIYIIMPDLIRTYFLKGLLKDDSSYTKQELQEIVGSNLKLLDEFRTTTVIYPTFMESAKLLFENNDKYSCLILVVTAIEHVVNLNLRDLLSHYGVRQANITEIIRSTNVDGKLGWLLSIVSDVEIPNDLKYQINEFIQLRNRLVHYKHPYTNINDPDYFSDIEKTVTKIDFETFSEVLQELEGFFDYSLELKDPLIPKSREMANLMFDIPPHVKITNIDEFNRYRQEE